MIYGGIMSVEAYNPILWPRKTKLRIFDDIYLNIFSKKIFLRLPAGNKALFYFGLIKNMQAKRKHRKYVTLKKGIDLIIFCRKKELLSILKKTKGLSLSLLSHIYHGIFLNSTSFNNYQTHNRGSCCIKYCQYLNFLPYQ